MKNNPSRLISANPLPANRGAFTLMELLVSVLIVAVLAALLFPIASSLVRQSKAPACMANLRTYGLGVFAMLAENGGAPIDVGVTGNYPRTDWGKNLEGYVPDDLHCPLRPGNFDSFGFTYSSPKLLTTFFPNFASSGTPGPASRIVVGSEMYFRGDGFYMPTHFWQTLYGCGAGKGNTPMRNKLEEAEGERRPPQYHGDAAKRGVHVIFLDGHIELSRIQVDDVGKLSWPMEDRYWDNNDFGPSGLSKNKLKP